MTNSAVKKSDQSDKLIENERQMKTSINFRQPFIFPPKIPPALSTGLLPRAISPFFVIVGAKSNTFLESLETDQFSREKIRSFR